MILVKESLEPICWILESLLLIYSGFTDLCNSWLAVQCDHNHRVHECGLFLFESSWSKAYSKDIQWRMIHQRCSLGITYAQIATNLNIDPSTVCRTVQLFEQTGTVESIQGYHEKTTKRLTRTWWYQVLVLELCLPSGLCWLITEVDLSQTIVSLSTALASARRYQFLGWHHCLSKTASWWRTQLTFESANNKKAKIL